MADNSYTITEYRTLKKAIAQGVMEVSYGDRKVKYNSLSDMKRVLHDMELELGLKRRHTHSLAGFRRY